MSTPTDPTDPMGPLAVTCSRTGIVPCVRHAGHDGSCSPGDAIWVGSDTAGPLPPADPLPANQDPFAALGIDPASLVSQFGPVLTPLNERYAANAVAAALAMGFGNGAANDEDHIARRAWDIAEALTREAIRRKKL